METVEDIFLKYNTDKNKLFHNYSRQYESVFQKFRDQPIKYLEIGVFEGQSLLAMREVFKNAEFILGIDINPNCKQYEDVERNIFVEIGDASDPVFLNFIISKYGNKFDIILDDGSHTNEHVIKTFEALFSCVKEDGIFLVEDVICYKSADHLNRNYPDHLSYFIQFIPFLNQWRYDSTQEGCIRDHCIDPFKIQKKTINSFEYSIDRIEFGCSYIVLHKKTRSHWIF
jgi:hypothetical protein